MIKHIVMWNLKGETSEEKAQAVDRLKNAFESLIGKIPGLLHVEIGIDMSKGDYACDVVLYSEFDSHESLAAYAVHAECSGQVISDRQIGCSSVGFAS